MMSRTLHPTHRGFFGMKINLADLIKIVQLKNKYNTSLIFDDANIIDLK